MSFIKRLGNLARGAVSAAGHPGDPVADAALDAELRAPRPARPAAAPTPAGSPAAADAPPPTAEDAALSQALRALDRAYHDGTLSRAEYERQRAALVLGPEGKVRRTL